MGCASGVELPVEVEVKGLLAPPHSAGFCNDYLPDSTTLERFIWVARFYAANGACLFVAFTIIDVHAASCSYVVCLRLVLQIGSSILSRCCYGPSITVFMAPQIN